ncbi:MAG: type II toxin-antitoxin system HicB family antitoxin [Rikenellaceae bacterium]
MKELKILIEKSSDYYDAYAENCPGVYGAGESVAEAKKNVLEGIRLLVETHKKEELPEILQGEYEIIYNFDTQSFLNYYDKIFSKSALERLTGINQKQLHHYASGIAKPRKEQRKKIETALHRLGEELLAVGL